MYRSVLEILFDYLSLAYLALLMKPLFLGRLWAALLIFGLGAGMSGLPYWRSGNS